ncbi:MAG: hypothetical protein ACR2KP_14170 [Egibacteraceae bacterium]
MLHALAQPAAQETIFDVFGTAIDTVTLVTQPARAEGAQRRLSATRPFLWSGATAAASRSVFSLQPCDSGLETQLVGFLDRCPDVAAFAKLAPQVRVSMEYRTEQGRLAYYYPDFAVRRTDGEHVLVEAKGLVDVPAKNRRAVQWAVDASLAAGVRWTYARVDQDLFERHAPRLRRLDELVDAVRARRREEVLDGHEARGPASWEEHLRIMEEVDRRIRQSGEVPDIDAAIDRFRDDPRG